MSVEILAHVMPPPASSLESVGSWSKTEELLGTSLPADFKGFIEVYGSGTINKFITIFNPFSSRPGLDFAKQMQQQLDAIRELVRDFEEDCPYKLFPEAHGLLPVGLTDNGDVIHWLTCGNSPDDWVVVVNESRSPNYERFDCNLTEFLTGVLEGSIESKIIPAISGHAVYSSI